MGEWANSMIYFLPQGLALLGACKWSPVVIRKHRLWSLNGIIFEGSRCWESFETHCDQKCGWVNVIHISSSLRADPVRNLQMITDCDQEAKTGQGWITWTVRSMNVDNIFEGQRCWEPAAIKQLKDVHGLMTCSKMFCNDDHSAVKNDSDLSPSALKASVRWAKDCCTWKWTW